MGMGVDVVRNFDLTWVVFFLVFYSVGEVSKFKA
jgi:hypothetical protein